MEYPYTFEITERAYFADDQEYNYSSSFVKLNKVGEGKSLSDNKQHIVQIAEDTINFMQKWLGENPKRIMRHKPVWTNYQYVGKVYFERKDIEKELRITKELVEEGILCPKIYDVYYGYTENVIITEYIGHNIMNDAIFVRYADRYYALIKQLRGLGYQVDRNPENYLVREDQLYVIDFESW